MNEKNNRDEFNYKTKRTLANRVGTQCSNPECCKTTSGPHSDSNKSVNIGVAAHINAAAPKGPRYDETMSSEERKSIENGIWLCQGCAKLIDDDEERYTAHTLRRWKAEAEKRALTEIETNAPGVSEETAKYLIELGMTRTALTSFFNILEQKNVPPEELDSTLREIAKRDNELKEQLRLFSSDDTEVTSLKHQAAKNWGQRPLFKWSLFVPQDMRNTCFSKVSRFDHIKEVVLNFLPT
ncbi:MAG: hypothetical protein AABY87_08670 [bacterium]